MTVKELKEKLENAPDNMDVFIAERTTEFGYGLLESAGVQEIPFMEDPDGEEMSRGDIFALSDEIES